MTEAIGYLGAVAFAICALPQAIASWRQGHSHGISWGFLLLWSIGEVLTLYYVAVTSAQLPLLLNYIGNLGLLAVIMWYKAAPRKEQVR